MPMNLKGYSLIENLVAIGLLSLGILVLFEYVLYSSRFMISEKRKVENRTQLLPGQSSSQRDTFLVGRTDECSVFKVVELEGGEFIYIVE